MSISDASDAPAVAAPPARPAGRAIFHPAIDFLCLGGLSLLLIPVVILMPASLTPSLLGFSLILADLVNHPHFAASYQIFYRDFRAKAFGDRFDPGMRLRYAIAGIAVPLAMIAFFVYCLARSDAVLLGLGANLMFFLVGWHYTKQGYGMLVVDSVFRRQFFDDAEKRVLRHNAYACWIFYWVMFNNHFGKAGVWGLEAYAFPLPDWAVIASGGAALVTSALALRVLARRVGPGGKGLPLAGTVAYVVSLYVWLAARFEPAALLVVPAFHSLQYLLIVGRYEINRTQSLEGATEPLARRVVLRLAGFAAMAVLLGLAGFWWLPKLLEMTVTYDREAFGGGFVFMFMFWIFINVHHYFIDNVIWRRENPEVGRHLFGATPKRA